MGNILNLNLLVFEDTPIDGRVANYYPTIDLPTS